MMQANTMIPVTTQTHAGGFGILSPVSFIYLLYLQIVKSGKTIWNPLEGLNFHSKIV